ncbi:hypothetical protein ACNKHR_11410 [Shigella flexneri]
MDESALWSPTSTRAVFCVHHHWRLVESVDAQPPGNHTHTQGSEIPGVIGSVAPHALTEAKATTAVI